MLTSNILKILWRSSLACALLFSGWGPSHLGSFFTEPVRAAFLILLIGRIASETFSVAPGALLMPAELAGFARWVPLLNWLTMAGLTWLLPFADRRNILTIEGAPSVRWLGLMLFLAGAATQWASIRTLGRQYSVHVTIQDGHRLVQDGLYGVVRHPIYLGLLLNLAGVSMVFRSWLVIPVVLMASGFLIWRIRQEELLLQRQFGTEFDAYRRRTGLLLPYL